ncbi:PREDICTED: glutamate receptor 2.8-like [Erythranthe guttata]|uniref:glutamate receptor 2.8-like n=1 Tax=Erythranthe guttata TaxID=4155 RepID=UPI00064D78B5|nr:PREDICTED: glutamate receptor 2.8-like [Erythranthe guttata]|eukprot:XP_012831251.1 PREDICTED: glutamate receptor 2.8-like [Erythranthe guttata]
MVVNDGKCSRFSLCRVILVCYLLRARADAQQMQPPDGDCVVRPKGWESGATEHLRVGIPWKPGFREFVNVVVDPKTNRTYAKGFCIDIFLATLKEYDMVVADATIWAPRLSYVDFTHPYVDSGVVLVVKNKKPFSMWIFVKPLRWDLWLAIIAACILLGVTLRVLERRRQSFTANLSAILTVDQLEFAFSDDYYVGYHKGSFMKEFLIEHLHIRESRMRDYLSTEEYHDALSKGSQNGGVDAVFDELPYMKLLLNRYKSQYKMVGPTYRTGGMGFAFPIGSPLVAHFSRAILNVTQGPNMVFFEQKNFGPGFSSQDPLSSAITQGTSGLTLFEFGGLFIITGSLVAFALIYSEREIITRKLTNTMRCFFPFCFDPRPGEVEVPRDNGGATNGERNGTHQDTGDTPQPHSPQHSPPAPGEPARQGAVIIDVAG